MTHCLWGFPQKWVITQFKTKWSKITERTTEGIISLHCLLLWVIPQVSQSPSYISESQGEESISVPRLTKTWKNPVNNFTSTPLTTIWPSGKKQLNNYFLNTEYCFKRHWIRGCCLCRMSISSQMAFAEVNNGLFQERQHFQGTKQEQDTGEKKDKGTQNTRKSPNITKSRLKNPKKQNHEKLKNLIS